MSSRWGIDGIRPFNPQTYLPWLDSYWSEDPTSGLPADGAAVTIWDDKGTRGLDIAPASGAVQPTMRASVAALGGKPAVEFTNDYLLSAAGTAVAQPYTQVLICNIRALPGVGSQAGFAPVGVASATRGIGAAGSGNWRYEVGANGTGGTTSTGPHFFMGLADGLNTALLVDATPLSFAAAGNTAAINTVYLGARNGAEFAAIDVTFYGVIGRALTALEATTLRMFAQAEYLTP